MANIITSCRILCSVLLLFYPVFSPAFNILYLIAGFTDIIDGNIARKTNVVSELGAKFDTVADFIFIVVCLIKLIPVLIIPIYLLIWTGIIAIIKIINIILGFIVKKKFVAVHSILNKVTGIMLFVFPLTIHFFDLKYGGCAVCVIATFAAILKVLAFIALFAYFLMPDLVLSA